MTLFAMPLCKEFVRRQYFPLSTRTVAYDMATALQETLMEMIRENGWIDDIGKVNALEKVHGMKSLVGYPDWITNDTILEEKFEKARLLVRKLKQSIDCSNAFDSLSRISA